MHVEQPFCNRRSSYEKVFDYQWLVLVLEFLPEFSTPSSHVGAETRSYVRLLLNSKVLDVLANAWEKQSSSSGQPGGRCSSEITDMPTGRCMVLVTSAIRFPLTQ